VVERAISTLVETATDQAARLGGSVFEHASGLAEEVVHTKLGRRARRQARRRSHQAKRAAERAAELTAARAERLVRKRRPAKARRRVPTTLLAVSAIGAIAAIVVVVRKRAHGPNGIDVAPDAFGAAVEAERDVLSGDGHPARPVATPGA
jgi:hypothetical protein